MKHSAIAIIPIQRAAIAFHVFFRIQRGDVVTDGLFCFLCSPKEANIFGLYCSNLRFRKFTISTATWNQYGYSPWL